MKRLLVLSSDTRFHDKIKTLNCYFVEIITTIDTKQLTSNDIVLFDCQYAHEFQDIADTQGTLLCGISSVASIPQVMALNVCGFVLMSQDIPSIQLQISDAIERKSWLEKGRRPQKSNTAFAGESMYEINQCVSECLQSSVQTIHIVGETGTGKEAVVDMFQSQLPGKKQILRVNCGAFPDTILESELFGHVNGAFTGALEDRVGLLESANGSYVFLDEVGTLSERAQASLLRVIENQEMMRVGESKLRKLNVKFISATNENLLEKIAAKKFRQDLFSRLTDTTIHLAPLRHRKHEIPDIVENLAKKLTGGPFSVDAAVIDLFQLFDWELGNVRQIRACLRSMTKSSIAKRLTLSDIPRCFFKTNTFAGTQSNVTIHANHGAL